MENKKEMTALDVSAATDTEQPISKCTDNSISEKAGKINDLETISMTVKLSKVNSIVRLCGGFYSCMSGV